MTGFGWSLPPGVTDADIEQAFGYSYQYEWPVCSDCQQRGVLIRCSGRAGKAQCEHELCMHCMALCAECRGCLCEGHVHVSFGRKYCDDCAQSKQEHRDLVIGRIAAWVFIALSLPLLYQAVALWRVVITEALNAITR